MQWFNIWSANSMICVVGMFIDHFIDLEVLASRYNHGLSESVCIMLRP